MSGQDKRVYVGVDIAKESFTAAWKQGECEAYLGEFANTSSGYEQLAQRLARAQLSLPMQLVVEPTGGYEAGILHFGEEKGWFLSRVNPFHVRRWSDGMGQRAKTDALDARLLARFGAATRPAPQWLLSDDAEELERLVKRQQELQKLLQAERNRLGQLKQRPRVPRAVQDSLEQVIQTLKDQIQNLDQAIDKLLAQSSTLATQQRLLCTVPGLGKKTSRTALLLCHRFYALTQGEGTAKQIVAFLGLDPKTHQSGRSVKRKASISKMGDRDGRSHLYLSALGGVRGHNPLRTFYHQLLDRGKAPKLALTACARKIIVWAWTIFLNHQPFDHNRHSRPVT